MSEFDKWFEVEMTNSHKKVNKERIETVIYSCSEASWYFQQTKIDELQGRIDGALNMLCKLQYASGERIYSDVGNILKGNKDEN